MGEGDRACVGEGWRWAEEYPREARAKGRSRKVKGAGGGREVHESGNVIPLLPLPERKRKRDLNLDQVCLDLQ